MTEAHDKPEHDDRPAKRVRTIGPPEDRFTSLEDSPEKELRVGITTYINPSNAGFSGILKQRYTDFLVNEISPSGVTVYLTSLDVPEKYKQQPAKDEPKNSNSEDVSVQDQAAPHEDHDIVPNGANDAESRRSMAISGDDLKEMEDIFGKRVAKEVIKLYEAVLSNPDRRRRDFKKVESEQIEDKSERTKAHHAIRRIFGSHLETSTGEENTIYISAATERTRSNKGKWNREAGAGRARGRLGWDELGGEYLHFTLYKENKDTMELCYFFASQLKQHIKNFQFAGTKDRRAVTVQRISAFRMQAQRLAGLNRHLRGARIGDFKYEKGALSLGDLDGNEFVITLRDSHFTGEDGLSFQGRFELGKQIVSDATINLKEHGFINYYGLQRFGSFAASTDAVGKKMLQKDLKGAAELILDYSEHAIEAARDDSVETKISSDDKNRALALHIWRETGNAEEALKHLPKRFTAETQLIKHLGVIRQGKNTNRNDYEGAFKTIQRNLRLMYVHAYQSLVWNLAASKRIELYGSRVVEGDLVIKVPDSSHDTRTVDEAGEVIIQPPGATPGGDEHVQARPLSKEEAASGAFTIFDIVLPLPGFDVVYPSNDVGAFYTSFMASDAGGGLDPHNMRRKWKDTSLSGGYRKLVERPKGPVECEVRSYTREDEQLVETDLERLQRAGPSDASVSATTTAIGEAEDGEPNKLAVIVKLRLPPSTYATMALRELTKGGVRTYAADFGLGR